MRRNGLIWVVALLALVLTGCFGGGKALQKYTVSGVIVSADTEEGVEGVTLTFSNHSKVAESDADGKWSQSGLSGSVTVTPSKEGWTFEPVSKKVSSKSSTVNFKGTGPASDPGTGEPGNGDPGEEPGNGGSGGEPSNGDPGGESPAKHKLTLSTDGEGTITTDPAMSGGSASFEAGTTVTLTAVGDPGWAFSHWTGGVTGFDNPVAVQMDNATAVTAVFVKNVTITSAVAGGVVTVDSDDFGLLEGEIHLSLPAGDEPYNIKVEFFHYNDFERELKVESNKHYAIDVVEAELSTDGYWPLVKGNQWTAVGTVTMEGESFDAEVVTEIAGVHSELHPDPRVDGEVFEQMTTFKLDGDPVGGEQKLIYRHDDGHYYQVGQFDQDENKWKYDGNIGDKDPEIVVPMTSENCLLFDWVCEDVNVDVLGESRRAIKRTRESHDGGITRTATDWFIPYLGTVKSLEEKDDGNKDIIDFELQSYDLVE